MLDPCRALSKAVSISIFLVFGMIRAIGEYSIMAMSRYIYIIRGAYDKFPDFFRMGI